MCSRLRKNSQLIGILVLLFSPLFCETDTPQSLPETFSGELAIVPEDMPRLPESIDNEVVLHPELKGLVIVSDPSEMLTGSELDSFEGFETKGLFIPGRETELKRKLEPLYVHQPLTRASLNEIKYTISKYFREHHYPLVVVEVPEQDITGGVLQLIVIEGRLGKIDVIGNEYVSSKRLIDYVSLRPSEPIQENRLIRDMNFINRNPFRRVDVVYSPGEEVGTTDLTLRVADRRPLRFYGGLENTGVPTTSRQRYFAGFNWGNAFNLDHIMAYQFTSAYNSGEFYAHTLQYIAPLSWHHILNIYGGYSRVHADLPVPEMRNTGRSYQASARYAVPLPPSRYLYHEFVLGYDWKRTNNTIEFSEQIVNVGDNVNISQFIFGYTGNYERAKYRLDFGLDVTWQPGKMMGDQSKADYETLRPDAGNDWVYALGQLSYLQRLSESWSLFLQFKGQATYQNLLPSEQFYFGGYDTVRGYDQRQVTVDNGVILSGELRTPPFRLLKNVNSMYQVKDGLQFLIFYDYGWGIDHTAIPTIPKAQWLMGVGPGIRYTIDSCLTARLDWGFKLHHKAAYGGGNSQVHFAVTASY
ncbi:MAG: ShlB/FhaC/HecB family hemolysin secretion/activation protein [Simkaniaceae bacterium]